MKLAAPFLVVVASLVNNSATAFTHGNANTVVNYYSAHSRYDVPQQGSILVEKKGVAKLQGGSDVEFSIAPPIPSTSASSGSASATMERPSLTPVHDVNKPGSILIQPNGVATVQGGSHVDFSTAPVSFTVIDEAAPVKATRNYIQPQFDVNIQGSIVVEKIAGYSVQGGAVVDWWQ